MGFLIGMAASLFYFGGLRLTLKELSSATRPRARVARSFWFRLTLLASLLCWLDPTTFVPFLLGFFGLRNVLVWRWS